MKQFKHKAALLLFSFMLAGASYSLMNAQTTIGSGVAPADGALLDLKENAADNGARTSTKGVIFPRVELSTKTTLDPLVSSSLPTHDAQKPKYKGTFVYNVKVDATEGLVEGVYCWDGTTWINLSEVIITGSNGVTVSNGSEVKLGGTLTGNTSIDMKEKNITFVDPTASAPAASGKVGIGTATPAAALHVEAPTGLPGFILKDGSQPTAPGDQKVLIYKADNGYAQWENNIAITSTVAGTLPATTGADITTRNTDVYTGASITLGPGSWMVSFGTAAGNARNNDVISGSYQVWYKVGLSTSSSSFTLPTLSSVDPINGVLRDDLTGTYGAGTISSGGKMTMVTGNIAIFVPNGPAQTFYLWGRVEGYGTVPANPPYPNSAGTSNRAWWQGCFGKSYTERWFYATPMN